MIGSLQEIPEIATRHGIDELLFAAPSLPAAKLREILGSCAALDLRYQSLAELGDSTNGMPSAALHALDPEDLLHRSPVAFNLEERRELISGRRVMVTGAAGSIGSEIARQVAAFDPARLVLTDINENGLYLLLRRIEQLHPSLDLRVEVADIRDRDRIRQLFEHNPVQDVLHAAAHKQVPLMEETPEEAIKNNVTGCRNVAAQAASEGVERFVFISTDKAVEPTTVMGASKRIAEMVVRDMASRSTTLFTAVRFGNVLGSAGSVVPLFKEQIAGGGPVTVTHSDCRRYIMTVPEAVGLVLVAGLADLGELCAIEMGEPIRIMDLARLMITISGKVPDRDILIEVTGLRPGEKLDERLMTDDELARSQVSRDVIRSVEVAAPAPDVMTAISDLERLALRAERRHIVDAICTVVGDYTPSAIWGGPAAVATGPAAPLEREAAYDPATSAALDRRDRT